MKKFNNILIVGKRWFQRSYGNTYFTARIYIDGELVHTLPKEYGYDDYYVQAATDWLAENGYTDNPKSGACGLRTPLWQYAQDHGIKLEYYAIDVQRERDLD